MTQGGIKQIARQRIQRLFTEAKAIGKTDPKRAAEYVHSARKIGMAARIRMPVEFRRQTCKNCNALLVQGLNCRVRVKQKREPHVVVTCLNCGNQTRTLLRNRTEEKNHEQNNHSDETAR